MRKVTLCLVVICFLSFVVFVQPQAGTPNGVPICKITPGDSKIKLHVDASRTIEGDFRKWDASLTFTSPDVTTGVWDVKIEADSVAAGSVVKNGKGKGGDFFEVRNNPYIAFHTTKVVRTGPNTFDLPVTFTMRGVSKPETRKMNSGIPFIKITDRVEVTVNLQKRESAVLL